MFICEDAIAIFFPNGGFRHFQSSAIKVDCSPPLPMMLFTTLLLSTFAAGYHLPEPPNCSEEELTNGYNYTLRGGWMDLRVYHTWPRDRHQHGRVGAINFTSAAGICTEKNLANASGNESLFCISTPLPLFSQCLRVKKSIPLNVTNVLSSCHDFESIGTEAWAWMREFQWCCSTWLCWRIGIGGVELFPLCFILRQSESVYGPSMVRSLLVFPWYIVSSPLV